MFYSINSNYIVFYKNWKKKFFVKSFNNVGYLGLVKNVLKNLFYIYYFFFEVCGEIYMLFI